MNILFTCGGTAGHVNPAVALARIFQERNPGCRVLFVGADGGMEMPVLGIKFVTTPIFKNTWTASKVMMPTMVRAPNLSRACRASQ